MEAAESSQPNGAADTQAGLADTKTPTNKTSKGSSSRKHALKPSELKAEPYDDLFDFSDLDTSVAPKVTSVGKIENKASSRRRKSTKDDNDGSTLKVAEHHADSNSYIPRAQISSAQIPGAQHAFLNNQSVRSSQVLEDDKGDELEPRAGGEPERKKQKQKPARQDTPFERSGSVADEPLASDQRTINHPSPTLPSPSSMQKLEKMLKYEEYLAEIEEQRYMREQASIDLYGMSDEETEPLAE